MQGLVSTLILGYLALVSTNSNENGESTNGTQKTIIADIFPSENVPQTPTTEVITDKNLSITESQIHQPITDSAKSSSVLTEQVLTQKNNGKVYSFQVPINSNEETSEDDQPLQNDDTAQSRPSSSSYQNVDLGDNVQVDFQYNVNSKSTKKPSKSLKDKWFKNKENHGTQEVSASSYGNHTTQIEGAGSGFLQIAQPHENQGFLNPENVHHYIEPNHHHQIGIHQEGQILHAAPQPQHHIVYNGQHDHQHHVTDEKLNILPRPHVHEEYILTQKVPKPLKPSIVHRDPNDFYDHHDKIRTLDKDHENQHLYKHHLVEHQQHFQDHHELHNSYPQDYHVAQEKIKSQAFQPYDYDMKKLPECAYKNKHFYNLTFCLEDHLYPLETILWALHQYGHFAHKLITDVTYQSADNLVTGLTRAEEEGYTYKHYYGATHAQHTNLEQYKPPYHGYTYKTDYFKKGGYICPSDVYYGRPRRAMNTYGQWKVIVNVDHVPKLHFLHGHGIHKKRDANANAYFAHKGYEIPQKSYTQTLRMEQCIYPNAPCSYISPQFHSRCIQKHNFVRLVAWTLEEGLHVDTFKLPIACSCHIPQPIHFFHESGRHEERIGSLVPPINNYLHNDVK